LSYGNFLLEFWLAPTCIRGARIDKRPKWDSHKVRALKCTKPQEITHKYNTQIKL